MRSFLFIADPRYQIHAKIGTVLGFCHVTLYHDSHRNCAMCFGFLWLLFMVSSLVVSLIIALITLPVSGFPLTGVMLTIMN